jgi:hypothetical protein
MFFFAWSRSPSSVVNQHGDRSIVHAYRPIERFRLGSKSSRLAPPARQAIYRNPGPRENQTPQAGRNHCFSAVKSPNDSAILAE